MEAVIGKISLELGEKWVLLITKLKLLSPLDRYEIESRYFECKESRATVLKNCSRDCIKQWMRTGPVKDLDDREKLRRLMLEMYKVEDFKGLVEMINQEGYDIVAESEDQPQANVESSYSVSSECTTRSVDSVQPQDYCSTPNVTPLVGRAEVSASGLTLWSYGDSASEHREPSLLPSNKPRISLTSDSTGPDMSPNRSKPTMSDVDSIEENMSKKLNMSKSVDASLKLNGMESLHTGGLEHKDSRQLKSRSIASESEITEASSNVSSGASMVVSGGAQRDGACNVPIGIGTNQCHLYTILDVIQRLPEQRWREFGMRLGLEESFMTALLEEEVEERYFLMIKKWVEISVGAITFADLREILLEFQLETAILVLDRLEGDGELLIRAIENDLA